MEMDTRNRFDELRHRSAARGLRLTPQRVELLRILSRIDYHPTADELFRKLRKRQPHLSPSTIYRNLQQFVDRGLISTVQSPDNSVRYDPNQRDHDHFLCKKCGRMFDVYLDTLDYSVDLKDSAGAEAEVYHCDVLLQGICGSCKSG